MKYDHAKIVAENKSMRDIALEGIRIYDAEMKVRRDRAKAIISANLSHISQDDKDILFKVYGITF